MTPENKQALRPQENPKKTRCHECKNSFDMSDEA